MNIQDAQERVASFAAERAWDINTPSQRIAHLVREVGKLSEHVLFSEGVTTKDPGPTFGKQVGDVFFSLIQLANKLGLDLEKQLLVAMEGDGAKYPAAETRAESLRAFSAKMRPLLEKTAAVPKK